MQYKESPVICGIRVYPLKEPGFSMVHYSVHQAIMTKKVSLKYKILCLRSVTSTIHTCTSHSGINVRTEVELYLLFRLQSGRSKFHH